MSSSYGFSSSIDNVGAALDAATAGRQSLAVAAIQRGAAAAQAKNYELAIREFRRATAYQPTDPNIYMYMGQVYSMMNRPDDAIASYKKALVVDPLNADAKNALADVHITQKNYGEAEKLLKEIARLDPTNGGPPTKLGFIYLNSDRLAEADTQFTQVMRLAPTSSTAVYNLGLVRNKQARYDEAVTLFERALSLDPKNERAHADIAYSFMGLDQPDNAGAHYRQLLDYGTSSARELAVQVSQAITTPKFLYVDSTQSSFSSLLGPGTPVSALDASLATPGASRVFKLTFKFNQRMDASSVLNINNWSITRGTGGTAGAYNYGANLHPELEAGVSPLPLGVTYDANTQMATVYFRVTQNDAGTAVIDPSHLVFKFSGKDVYGRTMDWRGDQYDGHAISPF